MELLALSNSYHITGTRLPLCLLGSSLLLHILTSCPLCTLTTSISRSMMYRIQLKWPSPVGSLWEFTPGRATVGCNPYFWTRTLKVRIPDITTLYSFFPISCSCQLLSRFARPTLLSSYSENHTFLRARTSNCS